MGGTTGQVEASATAAAGQVTSPAAGQTGAGVSEAGPQDVDRWLRDGSAVLIDVREPDEHARERIEGAALMPLSKFDARAALARVRSGQRLVLHCKSGRRSADAARQVLAVGGAGVLSMAGGIEAWKKDGLAVKLDTAAPGLSVMRQVQLVIGAGVLVGAVLGWLVHPAFLGLAAFFGAGLVFAGATGTCALATMLARMPWNRVKANPAASNGPAAGGGACCGGTCS